MKVIQLKVGPMANFVYVIVDEATGESMAIDSGWETKPIVEAVRTAKAKVKFVAVTHEHFDHTSTIGELARELGAKAVAHSSSPVEHEVSVKDGDEIRLGASRVKVMHTPAHTEDSICLYDGANVFTGDTLFVGTIGRFERSQASRMYRSLYEIIMKLPDLTVVYPGHDYGQVPSRSLGEEKAENVYLKARSLSDFVSTFS